MKKEKENERKKELEKERIEKEMEKKISRNTYIKLELLKYYNL